MAFSNCPSVCWSFFFPLWTFFFLGFLCLSWLYKLCQDTTHRFPNRKKNGAGPCRSIPSISIRGSAKLKWQLCTLSLFNLLHKEIQTTSPQGLDFVFFCLFLECYVWSWIRLPHHHHHHCFPAAEALHRFIICFLEQSLCWVAEVHQEFAFELLAGL